jgi:hypothetical protein
LQNVSTLPATAQVQADPTVFLSGRPPMGEFIQFLQTQTLEGAAADAGRLADQWRVARDRIDELTASEAGIADTAVARELPEPLGELASALLNDPLTRQTFGVTPTSVEMVELDKLVVYQKMINLTYARQLQSMLGEVRTDEALFHFALPTDGRYDPVPNAAPMSFGPHGALLWGAVSPSNDFRVLNTMLVDPMQISGLSVNGRPTHVFAVAVGYGSNLLSAIRIGRRLVLRNGSHRAYALRAAGVSHAPILVQDIPANEESELLPPEVQQHRDLYLAHSRPPLLRDYFDAELHIVVSVPRKAKQVRVQVAYEEGPALGV